MWEVPLETQQSEAVTNDIMAKTSKPELVQYLNTALFSPTTASLLNDIKQGLLKMWAGLTEKLTKRHIEKSRKTTMGHLHRRIQGLKSTKVKPPNTDQEDKIKTNVLVCTTLDPITMKEGKFYSDMCERFLTTAGRRGDTSTSCMCMVVIP